MICFPTIVFSQEKKVRLDTLYIESANNKLSVKLDLDNDIESFIVNEGGFRFIVQPNIDYRTEVSVNYRFISFKLGFSPHLLAELDEENRGETKVFKLETEIFIKKWIQTLSFYRVKGFYSPDFPVPDGFPTDYLILDQLKTYNYKGITRFRFNENYSIKAIKTQTEIQRKSAGTFMPSLLYSYNRSVNGGTKQDLNTLNFVLSFGYLHTFVINKQIYASVGASQGVGVEFNNIKINTDAGVIKDKGTSYTVNFDGHLGLGYNSSRWFTGAYFRMLTTSRKETSIVNYDTFRAHFQVFLGYRFDAPKFLKSSADWVEEKSPF